MRQKMLWVIIAVLVAAVIFQIRGEHDDSGESERPSEREVSAGAPSTESEPLARPGIFPSIEQLKTTSGEPQTTDACREFIRWDKPKSAAERDERERQVKQSFEILQSSPDPDHQLMAAMMLRVTEPDRSTNFIMNLVNDASPHPLAVRYAIDRCAWGDGFCDVADRFVAGEFEDVSANFFVWTDIATYRLNAGDEDGGFEALQMALAAPEVKTGFTDFTLVFDRGLTASTNFGSIETLMSAIGISAAIPNAMSFYNICREPITRTSRFRDICLRLAERQAAETDNYYDQNFGLNVQRLIYKEQGDLESAARLQDEIDQRADWTKRLLSLQHNAPFAYGDETLVREWFDRWLASNEYQASLFLLEEVQRKLDSGEYPPLPDCVGAG
ncbi:MAG: hypothetical protein AAF351_14625 [Pseudomonadota bacterium]